MGLSNFFLYKIYILKGYNFINSLIYRAYIVLIFFAQYLLICCIHWSIFFLTIFLDIILFVVIDKYGDQWSQCFDNIKICDVNLFEIHEFISLTEFCFEEKYFDPYVF